MIALSVYELDEEEQVFNKNEKYLLKPASNMKIFTTSTALYFLGEDYEFQTSVYHSGEIIDSVCYGDIFIKGGCDPDFTTADLDSLVERIEDYGIKEVKGDLYGDVSMIDSVYWGKGWMWDDDPGTDFPYFTPLTINDNAVEVIYDPGIIGEPADVKIKPESNFYDFVNYSVTTGEDTSDMTITRNWMERQGTKIIVKGDLSYKAEKDTAQVNLYNPEYYFLTLMAESMERHGIKFSGTLDTTSIWKNAEEIFSIERTFDSVIVNLNKKSDNLSAEMTLRALAHENTGKYASAEDGVEMVDSLIKIIGFEPENYRIVDGSGVSHYNLVSAELLLGILKYLYYEENDLYEILRNSFPVAGVDGTLENRMEEGFAYKRVHAKTGTLSGVSCLSGYAKANNGNNLAFSIMVQNHVDNWRKAVNFQDEICNIIADYK